MPLLEGQVQVRGLLMGPGTPYTINRFNPFRRVVRAPTETDRAFAHGSSSGAEHSGPKTVPIHVVVGDSGGMASWMGLDQRLAAAFRAVEEAPDDEELRFALGGREYVMFGRPRSQEPETDHVGLGWARSICRFVALDPVIYAAEEISETIGLPTFTGGLTVPFTVPFTIDATPVDGQVDVTNEGTTASKRLVLRIDGPVPEPRVTVQGPDGSVSTFRFLGEVPQDRFLLVEGTDVLVDGLPQANRRGQATWTDDGGLRLPGEPDGSGATSTILFRASDNEAAGTLTVSARSAWW